MLIIPMAPQCTLPQTESFTSCPLPTWITPLGWVPLKAMAVILCKKSGVPLFEVAVALVEVPAFALRPVIRPQLITRPLKLLLELNRSESPIRHRKFSLSIWFFDTSRPPVLTCEVTLLTPRLKVLSPQGLAWTARASLLRFDSAILVMFLNWTSLPWTQSLVIPWSLVTLATPRRDTLTRTIGDRPGLRRATPNLATLPPRVNGPTVPRKLRKVLLTLPA